MKCNSIVKYGIRGKKKPKRVVIFAASPYAQIVYGRSREFIEKKYGPEDIEICDGELSIDIDATDDSYCDCSSSPTVDVEVKCSKCGQTDHGINELNLNEIVQKMFDKSDRIELDETFKKEAETTALWNASLTKKIKATVISKIISPPFLISED